MNVRKKPQRTVKNGPFRDRVSIEQKTQKITILGTSRRVTYELGNIIAILNNSY
jgi:hypothetical protein